MEHEIIEKIEYILAEKLGWGVNFFETESNNTPMTFDGQMQITTEHGDFNLFCEIKKSVLPSSIPSLKETIDSLDIKNQKVQGAIILAHYISTNAREILHQKNLNYADTGGNIFIRDNTFHVYIETGQSDRSALTSEAGRAFTNAGLKVLYQFFRSDERRDLNDSLVFEGENSHGVNLNSSYSNIALQASVSKDTVSKVIQDLLEQGYILRKNSSEYKWKEKKVTFERWVSRINEIMRPSLNQKKYRFIGDPIVPENIPSGYQIGGYYGAQIWLKLTPSQEIINAPYLIYSHEKGLNNIVRDLKVVPDPNGNVTVMEAFWKDDSHISSSVDFPILYADLIANHDPRFMEIAQLLFKNYIHDHL